MVLGKLDSCLLRNEIGLLSYTTQLSKINSKYIKDLNIRADATELPEENAGRSSLRLVLEMVLGIRQQKHNKSKKPAGRCQTNQPLHCKGTVKNKKQKNKNQQKGSLWNEKNICKPLRKGLKFKIYKEHTTQ